MLVELFVCLFVCLFPPTGAPYEVVHDVCSPAHSRQPRPHQDSWPREIQSMAGKNRGEQEFPAYTLLGLALLTLSACMRWL